MDVERVKSVPFGFRLNLGKGFFIEKMDPV